MRSPVRSLRALTETALRMAALGLLVWAWLLSLGAVPAARVFTVDRPDLRSGLERWTTVTAPSRVRVRLDRPPAAGDRDWLLALAHAGTAVAWSGPSLVPSAISLTPRTDPGGGVDVAVAAPSASLVSLRDALGVRDSFVASAGVVQFHLRRAEPGTSAVVDSVAAWATPRDSVVLRRLLVLGRAGWETRFVTTALAERGWRLDARFAVAPGSDVYQGIRPPGAATAAEPSSMEPQLSSPFQPGLGMRPDLQASRAAPLPSPVAPPADPVVRIVIDTTRYSAVLALDSTAARYASAIIRYLDAGGGLLLWPEAAASAAFRRVAPGGVGTPDREERPPVTDTHPREALELAPITPLHRETVVLESRGSLASIAARRFGAGRVLQIGYLDAWRWRMAGGEAAAEAHRTWLASLVARVALPGRMPLPTGDFEAAPLAALIDRLGAPTIEAPAGSDRGRELSKWIFWFLAPFLLLEWGLRRIRGSR